MSEEPLLKPEEVASVLSTDGGEEQPAADPPRPPEGPIPFSLREPLIIGADGEPRARERIERLAAAFQRVLRRELEAELECTCDGFRQQQATVGLSAVPGPAWVLSFGHAGGGGIALVLHPLTALSLVELALGGFGNPPESSRQPTPLESRVMTKLATTLAPLLGEAIAEPLTSGSLTVGRLPRSFAVEGEIVGASPMQIKITGPPQTSALLVSARLLSGTSRNEDEAGEPRLGPLAARLGKIPVEVRPVLRAGRVSLEELLALEPGKALRFDTPEGALLDLRICGHTTFTGRVVRREDGPAFQVNWRRGRRRIPAPNKQEEAQ